MAVLVSCKHMLFIICSFELCGNVNSIDKIDGLIKKGRIFNAFIIGDTSLLR